MDRDAGARRPGRRGEPPHHDGSSTRRTGSSSGPRPGGTYGLRLHYTDRTTEITLNARWDGAQWVKDNTGFFSARFISNYFEVRWQLHTTTATSPFAESEWSGSVSRQFVFDTDGIGNGETLHDLERTRANHVNGVSGPGAELPFAA